MGTNVRMSSVGLSKIITIAPRFMVSNKTKVIENKFKKMYILSWFFVVVFVSRTTLQFM